MKFEIKKECGFTLVELLVVIAIIAVLTAIAVPAFLSQRQKSRDASVLNDVKNLATAVNTALIDCPSADIFQFTDEAESRITTTITKKNGPSVGPFPSWHTLSSDYARDNPVKIKVWEYMANPPKSCFLDGVTISKGNYLHLTEVTGFQTNRFLIYGWNPGGSKYTGETVTIAGDTGNLPAAANSSTAMYDSLSGGMVS